jgi:hypothetical protein
VPKEDLPEPVLEPAVRDRGEVLEDRAAAGQDVPYPRGLPEGEEPAVRSHGPEGVVRGEHHLPASRGPECLVDAAQHLRLLFIIAREEPPGGIEEEQAEIVAHVHDPRAAGPRLGRELHGRAGARACLREELLERPEPAVTLPVLPAPPVVVAGHEEHSRAAAERLGSHHQSDLAHHHRGVRIAGGMAGRVQALGIDDVPEHQNRDRGVRIETGRPPLDVVLQPRQDRVALGRRIAGIADEEEHTLHGGGVRIRQRVRGGDGAHGRLAAAGDRDRQQAGREPTLQHLHRGIRTPIWTGGGGSAPFRSSI